ncbi:phosphoribosylanthranilate isomerase [Rasiella rasia]|uniref:N-(5'-phosphoribosyl)anthranilate isomerase n=1 Tax=Rasiella rasia TaxID=2744027 RepID=A0A6G6GKP9_9FLAO|nr:phosphoribosylanthranilate isomerase [Rasiella rasia]QIE59132.1 phosphoribosylanthranilate isomerase [Rasiella rasia]
MKYNTSEVAQLQPDYLGFIFYERSQRNFSGDIPELPKNIKKVGVFVDASIDFVVAKAVTYNLDIIQLHGDESPAYCSEIRATLSPKSELWKVFSIKNTFDFSKLRPYEEVVNAFLFDTKGKEKGGNGITFNWSILNRYPSSLPIILSGGIGLEEISAVKKIAKTKVPIMAVDVNSKFETKPGLKDIVPLKKFMTTLTSKL